MNIIFNILKKDIVYIFFSHRNKKVKDGEFMVKMLIGKIEDCVIDFLLRGISIKDDSVNKLLERLFRIYLSQYRGDKHNGSKKALVSIISNCFNVNKTIFGTYANRIEIAKKDACGIIQGTDEAIKCLCKRCKKPFRLPLNNSIPTIYWKKDIDKDIYKLYLQCPKCSDISEVFASRDIKNDTMYNDILSLVKIIHRSLDLLIDEEEIRPEEFASICNKFNINIEKLSE